MIQKKGACLSVCLERYLYFISLIISTLVSFISRVPQSLGTQGIGDLKVETVSGIGGNEFMARRKLFQGREERFSY